MSHPNETKVVTQNETRESAMFRITRLKGKGIVAAGLFSFAGLLVAPAVWADNECMPVGVGPSLNGPLSDSYECDQTSYADGVTYTANGDLTVEFTLQDGVSTIGTATNDLHGIELTGTGSDSIFFDSATTNTELENLDGMDGALLGVTTVDGNIDIDTEQLDTDNSSAAGVTHAIFAESTGMGGIDVNVAGTVDVRGTASDTAIGIEALTDSGDIAVTTQNRLWAWHTGIQAVSNSGDITITSGGNVFAEESAVVAQTGGAGALNLTALPGNSLQGGVVATTGTGLMTINLPDHLGGGSNGILGNGADGLVANAGGDIDIYVGAARTIGAFNVVENSAMVLNAVGDITIEVAAEIDDGFDGNIDGGFNDFSIVANANSLLITNGGLIEGAVDFANLANGYVFNNAGTWDVSIGEESLRAVNAQRLSLLGEGTFNNSGTVAFGREETVIQGTGTTFNGLEGSTLDMLMTLSAVGQADCANPIVAGCLLLPGGTTTGVTEIRIGAVSPPLDPSGAVRRDANPGIVLVDVNGGTTAAENFVLASDSQNYVDSSIYGGAISTGGPLVYALLHNPDTQQHVLTSVPDDETITYGVLGQQVLSMWHTSGDAVVGRQADLRADATRGGWIRVVSDEDERASTPTVNVQGNTFVFEKDYTLDTTAVMLGMDAHTGDNHVLGLHTGFLSSDLSFDGSNERNRTHAKGAAAGVYGSWWMDVGPGQLTLDGTVNFNFVRLEHKNSFENTETDVRTNGIRAEAGWVLPVSETFYVQPLAAAAYVRADIETIPFRANDMHFVDTDSSRAALGVRLGGETALGSNWLNHLEYWLTARAWEENAEDGAVQFPTSGEPLKIEDNISESFEEVGVGASLRNADGSLKFFLSGNVESGDQTDSFSVTAGARMRW